MKCKYCGRVLKNESVCPGCGAPVTETDEDTSTKTIQININKHFNDSYNAINNYSNKSKIIVIILGLLFGTLGLHNFYLGYTKKAVVQLMLSVVGWIFVIGPMISALWSFIETILYAFDSSKTDASGKVLKW